MTKPEITWSDFEKIDFRSGTIINAEAFPEAKKPAYSLTIDFGVEIGIKKTSAQITDLYQLNNLVGKQVLGIVNLPKKQIGPIMSECLICGFYTTEGVVLTIPERTIENGSILG